MEVLIACISFIIISICSKIVTVQLLALKYSVLVLALPLSLFEESLYTLGFNFSDLNDYHLHSFSRTVLALTLWQEYDIPKSYHIFVCFKIYNIQLVLPRHLMSSCFIYYLFYELRQHHTENFDVFLFKCLYKAYL